MPIDISERLDRVERSARRWRYAFGAALLTTACALAALARPSSDIRVCTLLVLDVDAIRGRLGEQGDGSFGLTLFEHDQPVAVLHTGGAGGTALALFGFDELRKAN